MTGTEFYFWKNEEGELQFHIEEYRLDSKYPFLEEWKGPPVRIYNFSYRGFWYTNSLPRSRDKLLKVEAANFFEIKEKDVPSDVRLMLMLAK